MALFRAIGHNFYFMALSPQQSLEKKIEKIKQLIGEIGDLRPGALSQQYNVCGSSGCQCKATPPIKHGPYYQISFRRHGKSSSQFVRQEDVPEVQRQLNNYRRLRELVDEWITLSSELSRLRLREKRQPVQLENQKQKSRISKRNRPARA